VIPAALRGRATTPAAVLLLLLLAYVLLWPSLSPYDPNGIDLDGSRQPPSLAHPLGTDQFGRDLLTRVAAGGQTTLLIAGGALAVILVVGSLYGTLAALAGGRVDAALMRAVDGLLAIPRLPIAIIVLVLLGFRAQHVLATVFALSAGGWMLTARLVRGHVLTVKARDFVRASRAVGAGWPYVARRHVLPNSAGVVLVAALLELPAVVLGEAFLSLLGVGPQAPIATWGSIAYEGWRFSRTWEMALATAAIVLFATAANVLADAFHAELDPRRRSGRAA
jgi:ABC-type dipeptide/oligopeptide/nickel transport system permease subunit